MVAAGFSARRAYALDPAKSIAECSVDAWRSRDGLPGVVRALAQTAEGYLWIGTNATLARYGGGTVVAVPPPQALSRASDVTGLLAARDGTLWIAPSRGDPVCERAGVLADCLPEGQRLPSGAHIIDLAQGPDAAMWIASAEGIYRFADGHLVLEHAAASMPVGHIAGLLADARGSVWVGASGGLYRIEGKALSADARAPVRQAGAISALHEGRDGRIWAAGENCLLRLEGADGATCFGGAAGYPGGHPSQLIEDRDGNVWFGTRTGLHRFRPEEGFTRFSREDGLPEDEVTAVFEDREGSLWVGTRGWGMAQFTDRTLDSAGPPSLRNRWINSVAEDAAGALWVATRTGVIRWRREIRQEQTFTKTDGLPSDNVLTVHPGRAGDVWIGTDRGLARWHEGHVDRPVAFTAAASALHLDDEGVLWIGTADGVSRVREVNGGLRVEAATVGPGLQVNELRGMQHDSNGVLWLSAGGKLQRIDFQPGVAGTAGALVTPQLPPAIGDVGKIRSLYRDGAGTLWLGSGDGLYRYQAQRWTHYAAAQGLAPEDLFQVLSDEHGHLWASTIAGIVRITTQSLDDVAAGRRARIDSVSFHASDQRREVGAVRARQPGAWRGHDGRLWFATSRGLVSLDPARLRVNAVPPAVLIEEVLVDGRPAARGGQQAFPPGAGALEFHFSSITLIEPQKAEHRYRLEGFDAGWIEAGTRRAAYYTNIAPGHYRFRVQGSNADGVWNETGDSFVLTLAPHVYQTWWFYVLAAAAMLGLAFSFHRMHVAEVHSRYAATFAERNRVARELHDSLLQGMAAALLRMKGLRKRFAPAAPPANADAVAGALADIESLIGQNMEETRRFVWDLREQPGVAAPGLGPRLEQVVRATAEGASVAIDVRIDPGAARVDLAQHPRRELLQIAREAVANAITHAQASRIEVCLGRSGDQLTLCVNDDGRGFDPNHVPGAGVGHFGLIGMRERAASIGALKLETGPGQGTRVEVTIDLNNREHLDA
jgi:ligand-binding sensor domain-containing protein/signal transduction histidine kinase